jgi:hypothetical protein
MNIWLIRGYEDVYMVDICHCDIQCADRKLWVCINCRQMLLYSIVCRQMSMGM